MSRDDAHLGSDEEEEYGDDEEEVEKGGAAEHDEGNGGEEDEMVIDVESAPAAAQEGSSGSTAKEQDSQEECKEKGREERSQAAEDGVIVHANERHENDKQNEKERVNKAATDQSGENYKQREEGGDEGSEITAVNTNEDRHTEAGDNQGQSNTDSEKPTETEAAKFQTVIQDVDRNSEVATVEEAEQNIEAEPMEVDTRETSTTDPSGAVRGEDDTGTGWIFTLSYIKGYIGINECQQSFISRLNIVYLLVCVLCLRAQREANDSGSKERCAAAADDRCGGGSADPGPGTSSSGSGQRQIKGVLLSSCTFGFFPSL